MKPPRNKPCPCGSGRKAKWCCIIREEIAVARERQARYAEIRENYIDPRHMIEAARSSASGQWHYPRPASSVSVAQSTQPEPTES